MSKNPTVPAIHLNGSGAKHLLEQQQVIYDAAKKLEQALLDATPHDRDYYVLGEGIGAQARKENVTRLNAVGKILEDAGFLMMFIVKSARPGELE